MTCWRAFYVVDLWRRARRSPELRQLCGLTTPTLPETCSDVSYSASCPLYSSTETHGVNVGLTTTADYQAVTRNLFGMRGGVLSRPFPFFLLLPSSSFPLFPRLKVTLQILLSNLGEYF